MLSDDKFNKELKKYDKHLFLGKCLVYRDGEYFNAPTIYYWRNKRMKPEVVTTLRAAPCWGDLDKLKKWDTWAKKKHWMHELDEHNLARDNAVRKSAQDQINQVNKDIYKLSQRLERYGENASAGGGNY
tara:strand:+ start:63 stop:449 length:387 start_codon:yes stop_codon:yes gene_type:complete